MGLGLLITWLLHARVGMQVVVDLQTDQPNASIADTSPLISVIIPARNEQRNIQRCIQALLNQTYPNYEIIVVDDRSSDATPQILARLAAWLIRACG